MPSIERKGGDTIIHTMSGDIYIYGTTLEIGSLVMHIRTARAFFMDKPIRMRKTREKVETAIEGLWEEDRELLRAVILTMGES